jgi:hypothetical protein
MKASNPSVPHLPLSQSLETMLLGLSNQSSITLNDILRRTEGRGIFLVMILMCLPFVTPVSIPGVSSLSGAVVMVLSLRMVFSLPAWLPRVIGEHRLNPAHQKRFLSGSVKVLKFIEKVAHPRGGAWLSWPGVFSGNMLLIAFMAFLLALPILLPFTNTLPAYAILFLSVSVMEDDGRLIWLGYGTVLATLIYFGCMAGVIWAGTHRWLSGWVS